MDSSKNKYLLNVKRGLKWSERVVELTNETLHYFNPKDNELRFKSVLTDITLTEKYANNPKKYRIKLTSKTGKFKEIKLSSDDYTIIQKFKVKFDEIMNNKQILNNLKNKNLVVRANSTVSMPVGDSQEFKGSHFPDKPQESDLVSTNTAFINNSVALGAQDESASTTYDPRTSLMTDFNDDEHARKGKNVVDKFKHSLPSTVFKKREFVLDKSKTMTTDRENKKKLVETVESMMEKSENTNSQFVDEDDSTQRKASIEISAKPELAKSFPESIKNEIGVVLSKEIEGNQQPAILKAAASPVARPWRLVKASMFSLFEYNGEYSDIIKEVKKSLRLMFKDFMSESTEHNNYFELQRNNFEYNKFFLRVCIFLSFLFMYILFSYSSYTKFFIILTAMLVLYLFVLDIRKIIKIEGKFEKKFKDEKTSNLNKHIQNSAVIENPKANENLNLAKGNFLRISSVFNADKAEVSELLNNFAVYSLVDENVKKAEADNYYNQFNSDNANNSQIKTQYYSVVYKEKNYCYGKRGRKANKQTIECNQENNAQYLIKREISTCGSNNKFTFMIDYIKDEDQNDKILRIFFLENLSETAQDANLNEINFIKKENEINTKPKLTLVSLFIPIAFHTEFSKSTLDAKIKELYQKEITKKSSLLKSSLNFLDNIHAYFNNNLIQMGALNYNESKLSNLNNLALLFDEKFNRAQSQTDFSSLLSNKFKNETQIIIEQTQHEINLNAIRSQTNIDEQIAKMEALNLDPSRKSTIQRFNEIGNRYSFSDAVSNLDAIGDPFGISDIKYPEFIDKSGVKAPLLLVGEAAEGIKKTVTFKDELYTEIPANNQTKIEGDAETKLENDVNRKESEGNLINLNAESAIQEVKIAEPVPCIDPELKKENDEVFKILNNKAAELDSFLDRDWKILEEKEGFKSFYFDEKSGLRSIKSHVVISKNIKFIMDYLEDLNKRGTYDKNFDNGKILRKIDEAHNITYLKFKGKLMISPRDFVVCSRKEITDDQVKITLTNFESPKYPRNKGIERATMIVAGFILKKIDENSTSVTNFVCSDLKLSQMLVNTSLKEVAQSVKVLKDILSK